MEHESGGNHACRRRHRRLVKRDGGDRSERKASASQSMPDGDESACRCRDRNATDDNRWSDWAR
jgi:hypothetical protein